MDLAISLRGVTKTFGSTVAVDTLDLAMPAGALYGFIGPNGAGKTTTVRMIMAILLPDRGELQVLGKRAAIEAKDRVGYLPEERGVSRKMKVGAFLIYMARLKGEDTNHEPRGHEEAKAWKPRRHEDTKTRRRGTTADATRSAVAQGFSPARRCTLHRIP